ncbi:MAG: hypothetical protein R3C46_13070 [Hyphomonadaceae bacterium]
MSRSLCNLTTAFALSLMPGCAKSIDAHVESISLEHAPSADVSSRSYLGLTESSSRNAGEYIVVQLTTSVDLASEAHNLDIDMIGYSLHPCGSDETYDDVGDVFPLGGDRTRHRYEVRLPTTWAQLGWRKPTGELTRGWPPDVANAGLCMKIGGGNMMGMRVGSGELRVDKVRDLLR